MGELSPSFWNVPLGKGKSIKGLYAEGKLLSLMSIIKILHSITGLNNPIRVQSQAKSLVQWEDLTKSLFQSSIYNVGITKPKKTRVSLMAT